MKLGLYPDDEQHADLFLVAHCNTLDLLLFAFLDLLLVAHCNTLRPTDSLHIP